MLFFFFKSKQLHTHMSFIKYYPFNESWIHSNWQEDYQQDSSLDALEYKPGALVFLKEEFFLSVRWILWSIHSAYNTKDSNNGFTYSNFISLLLGITALKWSEFAMTWSSTNCSRKRLLFLPGRFLHFLLQELNSLVSWSMFHKYVTDGTNWPCTVKRELWKYAVGKYTKCILCCWLPKDCLLEFAPITRKM